MSNDPGAVCPSGCVSCDDPSDVIIQKQLVGILSFLHDHQIHVPLEHDAHLFTVSI